MKDKEAEFKKQMDLEIASLSPKEKERYRKRKNRLKQRLPNLTAKEVHQEAFAPFRAEEPEQKPKTNSFGFGYYICGAAYLACTGLLIYYQAEATHFTVEAWILAVLFEIGGPFCIVLGFQSHALKIWWQKVLSVAVGVFFLGASVAVQKVSIEGVSVVEQGKLEDKEESRKTQIDVLTGKIKSAQDTRKSHEEALAQLPPTYSKRREELNRHIEQANADLTKLVEQKNHVLEEPVAAKAETVESMSMAVVVRRIILTAGALWFGLLFQIIKLARFNPRSR